MRLALTPGNPTARRADSIGARRVAILTEMDDWSASTRYRALQYVPRLRAVFPSLTVSLAGDTVFRPPGPGGRVQYFAIHAQRYARRTTALPALLRETDAVFVQRGLYPMGPGAVAKPLLRYDGNVVFDLDDAVFRLSPDLAAKSQLAQWLYGPQQALALMRRADSIVVSTAALAEILPDGVREPEIVPTVPDPEVFAPVQHTSARPVRIGWAGTVGGLSYLDPLTSVFEELAASGLAELEVVSSEPWRGPAAFRRWEIADEIDLFSRFGIGIMPLPDTDYTRSKAGFKLLQYMAAGLPVVASPIGINGELIEQSGGGFLAGTPAEWRDALRVLAGSHELRAEMGARGRAFVERYADIDGNVSRIARLLAA